jgi:hypothetical protein
MEKFTKLKPKTDSHEKEDVVYSNDHIKLVNFEDWTVIKSPNAVVCIPYLVETNQIVLRHEYVPTYKMADGQDYHITIISGTIENEETPERALFRELEEEAGIVINPDYHVEFMKPLFMSKGNTAKFFPCIVQLTEKDYHEVVAKGDGSKVENMSKSVKVDAKYLNSINPSDLITEYMLLQMKNYLNIP